MSTKREREYERRRFEKWQQRQVEARARHRRQRVLAGSIAGGVVLVLAVVVWIAVANGGSSAAQSPTPTPTSTLSAPDPSVAGDRTWTGDITFNGGKVGISLDGHAAPQAVANFTTLAAAGFFDDTKCHRVTTEGSGLYVLQCGSPDGTASGTPGYTWGPIENAPSDNVYPAGTIAMARAGNDASSMGSQFFIVYQDSTIPADSAGGYTIFGKVTSGLQVIKDIAAAGTADGQPDGAPKNDVIIQKVETQ
ncbi:peptidylprolyl isomerase [Cellulomonas alba]|uniref:peptidylprolyl isomerase n=1 Tax=Cellulomonas alba TaxID=3053467 RepID=A0ABT7SB70_9CELL|nr:peptidylprolyl isomerase [Cellulomonas alba]MDM7853433.1 peptidylprolyl isomerase [Cellulomonas alba]